MNYITRHEQGTLVNTTEDTIVTIGIREYINQLCIQNLSTYQGRNTAAAKVLNSSHLVPIFIDTDTLLIPTKSIRDHQMMYLNFHQIQTVIKLNQSIQVQFIDQTVITINISYRKWLTQVHKAQKLWEFYICANQKESVYTPGFLLDFL